MALLTARLASKRNCWTAWSISSSARSTSPSVTPAGRSSIRSAAPSPGRSLQLHPWRPGPSKSRADLAGDAGLYRLDDRDVPGRCSSAASPHAPARLGSRLSVFHPEDIRRLAMPRPAERENASPPDERQIPHIAEMNPAVYHDKRPRWHAATTSSHSSSRWTCSWTFSEKTGSAEHLAGLAGDISCSAARPRPVKLGVTPDRGGSPRDRRRSGRRGDGPGRAATASALSASSGHWRAFRHRGTRWQWYPGLDHGRCQSGCVAIKRAVRGVSALPRLVPATIMARSDRISRTLCPCHCCRVSPAGPSISNPASFVCSGEQVRAGADLLETQGCRSRPS